MISIAYLCQFKTGCMKYRNTLLAVILGTTALLGCDAPANNQANEPAPSANQASDSQSITSIQWLDSTSLDKGVVTEGEKVEIVYHFKNTGEKPLIIKDVRPSCGCTVAEKPLEPIAPGKEGSIKAIFDSQNRPGPAHKTLTVIANTEPANYALTFNVVVNKKS